MLTPLALGLFLCIHFLMQRAPDPHEWMVRQIESDLASVTNQKLSREKLREIARDPANEGSLFILFTIQKNKVSVEHRISPSHPLAKDCLYPRIRALQNSLQKTIRKYPLPDMDFIVSIHDALLTPCQVPVFVMAKVAGVDNQILIPDFEALRGRYQVLEGKDITEDSSIPAWEEKKEQLIWRGGPGQHPREGCSMVSLNPEEPDCLSRIKLCDLADKHPDLVDARFTYLEESYRSLSRYVGGFVPYESQIGYKYQMQIDGYSCAYTTSGWKLFTNSVMFKEDSKHIQWYSNELKPYVHYIPIKEGLSDLLDQIHWAIEHDDKSKEIASQARAFALSHITEELNRLYLYHALLSYSRIDWTD